VILLHGWLYDIHSFVEVATILCGISGNWKFECLSGIWT
jgi:hypothetical protein